MVSIDVKEATIRTAAVEVKTLSVSGKQVTMGLFRQLKERDLIEPDSGELMGTAWGNVNYFWGDCKDGGHLHTVWQDGQELYRSCVRARKRWRGEDEVSYKQDCAHRAGHAMLAQMVVNGTRMKDPQSDRVTFNPPGLNVEITIILTSEMCSCDGSTRYGNGRHWTEKLRAFLQDGGVRRNPKWLSSLANSDRSESRNETTEEAIQRAAQDDIDLLKAIKEGYPFEETENLAVAIMALNDEKQWWTTATDTYTASYDEVEALPQLFIAV